MTIFLLIANPGSPASALSGLVVAPFGWRDLRGFAGRPPHITLHVCVYIYIYIWIMIRTITTNHKYYYLYYVLLTYVCIHHLGPRPARARCKKKEIEGNSLGKRRWKSIGKVTILLKYWKVAIRWENATEHPLGKRQRKSTMISEVSISGVQSFCPCKPGPEISPGGVCRDAKGTWRIYNRCTEHT